MKISPEEESNKKQKGIMHCIACYSKILWFYCPRGGGSRGPFAFFTPISGLASRGVGGTRPLFHFLSPLSSLPGGWPFRLRWATGVSPLAPPPTPLGTYALGCQTSKVFGELLCRIWLLWSQYTQFSNNANFLLSFSIHQKILTMIHFKSKKVCLHIPTQIDYCRLE